VLKTTREREDAIRKETLDGLQQFKKHQEELERKAIAEQNAADSVDPSTENLEWTVGPRKRKAGNEGAGLLKGIKLRKSSSSADTGTEAKKVLELVHKKNGDTENQKTFDVEENKTTADKAASPTKTPVPTTSTPKPSIPISLSLGYTSSDEDD
jgi:hypothetical protein